MLVPNPERKIVFGGMGVAGRFAGGPIFNIHAVTHFYGHHARGGRPLGFGRQLPPQLTVGRRPLGRGGGGGHWRGV